MPSKKDALLAKGIVAASISIGLGMICIPLVIDFGERAQVDQGARPLVIISTRGGEKKIDLHVVNTVATNGDSTFTFAIDRPEATGDDERAWVEYEVAVIGSDLDGLVNCGGSAAPLTGSPAGDLPAGPSYAYLADRLPGRASATNFGDPPSNEATPLGSPSPTLTPQTPAAIESDPRIRAYHHAGNLATYNGDETIATSWSEEESGYGEWVGECTLRADAVWAAFDGDEPTQSARATYLAPQFNFTSIDATTDFQSGMDVALRVERSNGAVLTESYPPLDATDSMWTSWCTVTWQRTLGEPGNYAFSDQPTLLFSNRDQARHDQFIQLLAGLALGLALALMVRAASDFVDASTAE